MLLRSEWNIKDDLGTILHTLNNLEEKNLIICFILAFPTDMLFYVFYSNQYVLLKSLIFYFYSSRARTGKLWLRRQIQTATGLCR